MVNEYKETVVWVVIHTNPQYLGQNAQDLYNPNQTGARKDGEVDRKFHP